MQEQYSEKDQSFLEREWRLIFLAFLKPIINGNGHDFKEPQISAEKRLDVVITYFEHKYIIELKRWNGEKLHQEGLDQLSTYLDLQNKERSYLVIFEYKPRKLDYKKPLNTKAKKFLQFGFNGFWLFVYFLGLPIFISIISTGLSVLSPIK